MFRRILLPHSSNSQPRSQACSLGERPWVWLVKWPPGVWVVKKKCWAGGVEECFFASCVSNPRAVAKDNLLYLGSRSNFAVEKCYIIFAVSKYRIRRFSFTKKYSAAEWSINVLTVSTWKMSRAESKWLNHSLESLNSESIYFLLRVKFWSCHTAD